MSTAVVGHTGFVGSTLLRQLAGQAEGFNSKNIASIRGRKFERLLLAGAPAAKWIANKEPEADWANLQGLMSHLAEVEAEQVVLYSTVDVFGSALGVDEDSPVQEEGLHAYGLHRYRFERFVLERFPKALVLRLPGLFGQGLKKNAVYDLIHANQVEKIDPEAVFQFYDLGLLWPDSLRYLSLGVSLGHLAAEPLSMAELAERVFGATLALKPGQSHARYDFRSKHAAAWGRQDGYQYSKAETLERLRRFVALERGRA